mmetsp:Transcript_27593/g.40764  ORF Transcript_27593/g.40764 Transcript_27593/m.40764 type:complete len:89 (-) Transcript_27593:320-586(-)
MACFIKTPTSIIAVYIIRLEFLTSIPATSKNPEQKVLSSNHTTATHKLTNPLSSEVNKLKTTHTRVCCIAITTFASLIPDSCVLRVII